MPDNINLKHVSFKTALIAAYDLSKMTKWEIATTADLPLSSVERYLKRNDAYLPNCENIPALCRAMKTRLPLDWIEAQLEDIFPCPAIEDAYGLSGMAMSIAAHVGELCEMVHAQVADNTVQRKEAILSQAKLAEMARHIKAMHDALEPLASGQITDRGDRHESA